MLFDECRNYTQKASSLSVRRTCVNGSRQLAGQELAETPKWTPPTPQVVLFLVVEYAVVTVGRCGGADVSRSPALVSHCSLWSVSRSQVSGLDRPAPCWVRTCTVCW